MGTGLFTQKNLVIPLCAGATVITSNTEMDSFNMKLYNHATIIMVFLASMTGDNILTLECGATDSSDTSDATFHYRLGGTPASASSDVLAADATSSALTLTAATYQGKMLVVELNADELPKSGETVYDWVTVDFDGSASTASVTAFAILSEPRYARAIMPTAIPTT
ncbi:hypothetical protein LCGC14_2199180 [marine sediment metagenome]|uniref:Uncharacterized protein n=1 Tax=marine sediment metagenome TaxID=412755 RepID=A0A0F9GCZ4_9ZZZZ